MGKLAVVFPGIGYHTDKPLLYYGKKLAATDGYEIVDVTYGEPTRATADIVINSGMNNVAFDVLQYKIAHLLEEK